MATCRGDTLWSPEIGTAQSPSPTENDVGATLGGRPNKGTAQSPSPTGNDVGVTLRGHPK